MRFPWLIALAGCAPHYEWVETPSPAPDPEAEVSPIDARCDASSGAVRQQARQGRFQGVEGFDSRGCIGSGDAR